MLPCPSTPSTQRVITSPHRRVAFGNGPGQEDGGFTLETIVPGLYPGRTRHIHVMAQAANQPVLTTQLYFPEEPANAADGIFNPALVMDVQDPADGEVAYFTFVLDDTMG